jgi:MFS family permease
VAQFFVTDARREGKPFLFVVALIAALGGFLFGYDTGVISGALLYLKGDLHASTFQQEAIVGVLLIGAAVGAIIARYLADAISRRWTKVLSGSVYTLAALACAFSQSPDQLIGARFVLGLSVGTASFVSPMYLAELSPKRIRGGLVSFNQLMIVSGILAAYIVNFGLKGIGQDNWRWILGLGAVPGLSASASRSSSRSSGSTPSSTTRPRSSRSPDRAPRVRSGRRSRLASPTWSLRWSRSCCSIGWDGGCS